MTGTELRERFGETEVEHEETDSGVPIESETRPFAAYLDRAEADLAREESDDSTSRRRNVPPEVW